MYDTVFCIVWYIFGISFANFWYILNFFVQQASFEDLIRSLVLQADFFANPSIFQQN